MVIKKNVLLDELHFCLTLRENEGGCTFGGGTRCESCAVPYLLLKFLPGEVVHGDMQRWGLCAWQDKYAYLSTPQHQG